MRTEEVSPQQCTTISVPFKNYVCMLTFAFSQYQFQLCWFHRREAHGLCSLLKEIQKKVPQLISLFWVITCFEWPKLQKDGRRYKGGLGTLHIAMPSVTVDTDSRSVMDTYCCCDAQHGASFWWTDSGFLFHLSFTDFQILFLGCRLLQVLHVRFPKIRIAGDTYIYSNCKVYYFVYMHAIENRSFTFVP